jgi:hypothetical protein
VAWEKQNARKPESVMKRSIRQASVFAVLACLLSEVGPAFASEYPPVVRASIARVEGECRSSDGTPRRGFRLVRQTELNGDGRPDWILDYRHFDCKDGLTTVCGSGGCALVIFLSKGTRSWAAAWDENVREYRLLNMRGERKIELSLHGVFCGRTGSKRCVKQFTFRGSRMVPAR